MSSHDPFAFFGLSRKEATEADIKKAYAERLKTTRPEDDREKFMALRTAFDQARAESRWRDEYGEDEEFYEEEEALSDLEESSPQTSGLNVSIEAQDAERVGDLVEPLSDETTEVVTSVGPPQPEQGEWVEQVAEGAPAETDPVLIAMDDIRALTKQPFAGTSFDPWLAILNRDELQTIDEYQHLSQALRWFVCDETGMNAEDGKITLPHWLTMNVFKALCEHYGWHVTQNRDHWVIIQTDWLRRLDQALTKEVKQGNAIPAGQTRTHDLPAQDLSPRSGGEVTNAKQRGWFNPWRIFWILFVLVIILRAIFSSGSTSGDQQRAQEIIRDYQRQVESGELDPGTLPISEETRRAAERVNEMRRQRAEGEPTLDERFEELRISADELEELRKVFEANEEFENTGEGESSMEPTPPPAESEREDTPD